MPQIPSRIFEIVQHLKEDKQPRRATVRTVLKWFNASRRGTKVMAEIHETLAMAGLETVPPFVEASIDEPLRFVLRLSAKRVEGVSSIVKIPIEEDAAIIERATNSTNVVVAATPDLLEPEGDDGIGSSNKADDRPVASQPHDWTLSTLRDKWDRG